MCIRGKVIVRLHSFAGGCWSNHDVSMRYAASKCFGVVMWIECTATCLETHWIWLLEMSHAWGRVNLSSFVGLELLGAVIARQWWQEKRRLDYDSKPSNENKLGQDQKDHVPGMFVCGIGIDDALFCKSSSTSVGIDLTRVRLERIRYGTRRLN